MLKLLSRLFNRNTSSDAIRQADVAALVATSKYQPSPREMQQTADSLDLGVQAGDLTPGARYTVQKIGSRWKVFDKHGNPMHSSRTLRGAHDYLAERGV